MMKEKYFYFIIIFVLLLFSDFQLSASENAVKNNSQIIKSLDENQFPSEFKEKLEEKGFNEPKIENTITPDSATAERIVFIRNKNACPIVAKLFKNLNSYLNEHSFYKAEETKFYIGLINDLKTKCGYKLPIITNYKGKIIINGLGAILVEKAEGKELGEYFDAIPNMPPEQIEAVFSAVGAQMGALDALTFKAEGKVLAHGDSNAGNYIYDDAKEQLYWIDWSGSQLITGDTSLSKSIFFLAELAQLAAIGSEAAPPNGILNLRKTLGTLMKIKRDSRSQFKNIATETLKFNGDTSAFSLLSQKELENFKETLKDVIRYNQKRLIALKSFGKSYCMTNPSAKDSYNKLLQEQGKGYMNPTGWTNFIEALHKYERYFNLIETPLVDPTCQN